MEAVAVLNRADALTAAPLSRVGRIVVAAGLVLLAASGALMCARRLLGALAEPLSPTALIGVAVSLAAAALVFRAACAPLATSSTARYAVWAAPSLVLLLWLAGLSLSGSNALGMAALFGVLLLEEGWSWGRLTRSRIEMQQSSSAAMALVVDPAVGECNAESTAADVTIDDEGGQYDPSTTQQLVRRIEAGREVIHGWTRVDFAVGQRHAAAHVAICPPLAHQPECEAEQADGPPAELKVTQAMTYGIRCEVKLDEPASEATSVIVEFAIQEPEPEADNVAKRSGD